MPYFDAKPQVEKNRLDDSLAYWLADNYEVASQVLACGLCAILEGFYFQIGTNKACTSFMFAFKKEGKSVVFYADSESSFVNEFGETLSYFHENYPTMARRMQALFQACKAAIEARAG